MFLNKLLIILSIFKNKKYRPRLQRWDNCKHLVDRLMKKLN
jgi:hypothetical protein